MQKKAKILLMIIMALIFMLIITFLPTQAFICLALLLPFFDSKIKRLIA